jgi:predicted membrane protein
MLVVQASAMASCCSSTLSLVGLGEAVAGSGDIIGALFCTAMMAAMMFAMPGRHDHQ